MIRRGAIWYGVVFVLGIVTAMAQGPKPVVMPSALPQLPRDKPPPAPESLAHLRASGWDFTRRTQDNIQLLSRAFTVTEYEGPPMIRDSILDQLLRAHVPVDNFYGCKVLETAARTRRIDVVRRMLAAGAPLQAPPGAGFSMECNALSQGVEGGDTAIVALLLARHPDPNFRQYPALGMVISAPGYVPGQSLTQPQRDSLMRLRAELVRLLLAAGADPRVQGALPRTPEYYLRGHQSAAIDRLLDGWLAAHPTKD